MILSNISPWIGASRNREVMVADCVELIFTFRGREQPPWVGGARTTYHCRKVAL